MNVERMKVEDAASAMIRMRPDIAEGAVVRGAFGVQCFRKNHSIRDGVYHRKGSDILYGLLWEDNMDFKDHNLIVNTGLTYLVGSALIAVTVDTTWFVGLTDNSPTVAAADTLASHAGWVEFTEYDEVNRQAWVGVAGSAGVVTNAASPATFTINAAGGGLGGAFLAGVNTGTSGTLFSGKALTGGNRIVADNDVVQVTYVVTITST